MPSPFPGMDPYLEAPDLWGSVHSGLIYAIHAELNRLLPAGYVARIDEYVWVQEDSDGENGQRRKPDVFTIKSPSRVPRGTAVSTITRPTSRSVLPRSRRRKHRRVLISTARSQQILTAIEVLSPSNKRHGEDHDAYLLKRREYLGSVNLVEIDLLRTGGRMESGSPPAAPSDYLVLTCLAEQYPAVEVWGFNVRNPLPIIPVVVGEVADPTPLELRPCLDRLYDDGSYDSFVDYSTPPSVPLRDGDAEWAAELLKKHARKRK